MSVALHRPSNCPEGMWKCNSNNYLCIWYSVRNVREKIVNCPPIKYIDRLLCWHSPLVFGPFVRPSDARTKLYQMHCLPHCSAMKIQKFMWNFNFPIKYSHRVFVIELFTTAIHTSARIKTLTGMFIRWLWIVEYKHRKHRPKQKTKWNLKCNFVRFCTTEIHICDGTG